MAGNSIKPENVRIIFMDMISEYPFFEDEGKEAEKLLTFIAGAYEMANAIIKAINDLEGK